MIATEEQQTSEQGTIGQTPDKLDMNSRKNIMKNMYSQSKRNQEILTFSISIIAIMANMYFFVTSYSISLSVVCWSVLGIIIGMTLADFFGGFVHWAADTWFTIEMPILGPNLIRPFREHHIDPSSILNHDFIETNADTFTLTIPFMIRNLYLNMNGAKSDSDYFYDSFLISLCIFVSFTNEFHKWSHAYGKDAYGPVVTNLQKMNVILPREHHRIHHVRPHHEYYCITTGWLDKPLEAIKFWRRLEALITSVTGAIPRDDDMKWTKLSSKSS